MSDRGDRDEGPRSFARFVEQAADGAVHAEVSAELHQLVTKLQDESLTRDAVVSGELSLKLSFKAQPNGVVHLGYEIKRKDPKRKTTTGIMWITPGGNLSVTNPRQTELPILREVAGGARDARDVGQARGAGKEIG
jgi:hypothetical protein